MPSQVSLPVYQISTEKFLFRMPLLTSLCLLLSMIYWFYRLLRAMYNIFTYFNIRSFYAQALDIQPVIRFSSSCCESCALDCFLERTAEYDMARDPTATDTRSTNASIMHRQIRSYRIGYSQSIVTLQKLWSRNGEQRCSTDPDTSAFHRGHVSSTVRGINECSSRLLQVFRSRRASNSTFA